MVCLETSVSTIAESRKPSASGQSTCQNIANDKLSASPNLLEDEHGQPERNRPMAA